MDFLLGKSDSKITKVNICIDHEGYATTSNEITQNVNTPYPSNISKVVSSKFGTVAFDEDGEEILRLDLNQEMDEVPGIGMALTEDQINSYGLGIDLNSTTQFYASSIAEEISGQSWNEGDKFFFSFPSKDVVVDQSNLYQIQNEYDEKGEIIKSFASTYKQVGEQLIPEMNLVSRYKPLSNGQRLQTSSIKQYLSYTIKVNDQLVFRVGKGDGIKEAYAQAEKVDSKNGKNTSFNSGYTIPSRIEWDVSISPNPANNYCNILFDDLWLEKSVTIVVLNTDGRRVLMDKKQNKEKTLTMIFQS